MSRLLNVLLIILVIIAFFFGVRVGKTVQSIDTPVKIEYKTKKAAPEPTLHLVKKTIKSCLFSFIAPNSLIVEVSSQSALFKLRKEILTLSCLKNSKEITASGSSSLYESLQDGFDSTFKHTFVE